MMSSYLAVGAYALLIVFVGLAGMRRTRSYMDFLHGGGRVGPWMTAFSYGTAYFSAVLFIGFAGKLGWAFGVSTLWIALGNTLLGTLGVWLLLGRRIRATRDLGVNTMPEYLEVRYDSSFIKGFSALCIFVFMVPYTAAVFMGLSYLFEATFGLPYVWILLFMGIFTAMYMAMGGYRSMAMIDVFFGVIMTAGVLLLLWSTLGRGGGVGGILQGLREIDPALAGPVGPPGVVPLLSLVFLTSAAPFAMPQLLQKFYAVRDARTVRVGTVASTFFALLVTGTAYFVGATTRLFLNPQEHPDAFTAQGAPVFDNLMPELLTEVIPGALTVIILLLVLSASMSTLASLVLVSSSTLTKDFYHGFVNRNAGDRRLTALGRGSSVFFVLLSMVLAWMQPAVIVTILAISWGALASVFLGPFLWGLLSPRARRGPAIASSLLGLGVCIALFFAWGPSKVPQAASLGMLVSLAVPALSLLAGFPGGDRRGGGA